MVLLTVLYDTAARVSELVDICIRDVWLDAPAVITLRGKGGKIRSVPLMKQTVELIRAYFAENKTIFYKGIMPSEKVLDLPVDCNTLAGSVNL